MKFWCYLLLAAIGQSFIFRDVDLNAAEPPNVIFILADDIGVEGLHCYGGVDYDTPVLDELAHHGVRFTNAFSHPLCTPSRVLSMTGRYGHRNYIGFGELNPEEITFGQLFRDAGYATCIAGKWQLGKDRKLLNHFGFDEYLLWWLENKSERYQNVGELIRNGKVLPGDQGNYGPDVVNDFVLDFISRHHESPFFCYYPMILVHDPFVPTPDSQEQSSQDSKQNFRDMVHYMDSLIGKLTNKLEQLGIRDNTLILFAGDNGTHHDITSSLRDGSRVVGGKGSLGDTGTRVPMIVNWSGIENPGRDCEDLIDFSDILPTLCDASSISLPQDRVYDGISFLPTLKYGASQKREWVFFYFQGKSGQKPPKIAIRDRNYLLMSDGSFYDPSLDPLLKSPLVNLSMDDLATKQSLKRAMKEVIQSDEQAFSEIKLFKKMNKKRNKNHSMN